jgi:inhibitor of cysteine peptidase
LLTGLALGGGTVLARASGSGLASGSAPQVNVQLTDNGRNIDVPAGNLVVLALPANPSTGYGWEIDSSDATALSAAQPEFQMGDSTGSSAAVAAASLIVGAPQTEILRFSALRAGQTAIKLSYRRPWEKAAATQSFGVTLVAHGAGAALPVAPAQPLRFAFHSAPETGAEAATSSLPTHFNWCDQGKCTPIKNQGNCGSCWAFSTVGVLEQELMANNQGSTDLSEQYLLSCNTSGYSCAGGWFANDYHEWEIPPGELAAGAVPASDFPYQAADVACNAPHIHTEKIASWAYISGETVPSTAAIKQAIQTYGPVAATVCVGPNFENYTSGVFSTNETCGSQPVNHAIVLTGWDDTAGAWYLRNSWGTGWGESGYMQIAYGTSNVGFSANYVVLSSNGTATPTATSTSSPTPTRTPSPTSTRTPSPTPTRTPSPTPTRSPSPTPTRSPSPTATRTPSPTATRTPSPTATRTPSPTPTRTATRGAMPTRTPTPPARTPIRSLPWWPSSFWPAF